MTINKKTVALFALDVASVVFGNFATKMAIVVVKNILKNVKESAQVRAGLSGRPPVKGFAFTLGASWSLLLNCNLDKSAFLRYNIIVRGGEETASEREPLLES